MEVAIVMTLSLLFSGGLVGLVSWYYARQYEKIKHKFSDAEIFRLMARANHFITAEQLSAVSPLTLKEAKERLMHLSMINVLRRFQDASGMGGMVYQLKEAIPEDDVLPISIKGLTEKQIVDAVLKYSEDYQITIAELVVIFDITVAEAKQVMKRLKKNGLVGTLWKGFQIITVIKDPLTKKMPNLDLSKESGPVTQKETNKLKIPTQQKLKIPDADVLNAAVANQGKLTPITLCLKLKIPLNEARLKLEELYEEGAFIMDVDEQNAVIEYHLRDKSLLS